MTEKEFVCWLIGYFLNLNPRILRNNHLSEIKKQMVKIK